MGTQLKVFNAIFLTAGIILLAFGSYGLGPRLRLQRVGITANGRVIGLQPKLGRHSTTYSPVVTFRTRDEREITFTSRFYTSPPSFRVDEDVTVLYDPENPQDAYIQTFMQFWGVPIILSGMGLFFAGIPTGILLAQAHGRRRARWLKQCGRRISTEFQSVERVTSIRVNGENPYRIVSRWQDPVTNLQYVFHSFNLWRDPTPLIATRSIDVLIDPSNPNRYWLDTDFLGDPAD